MEQKRDGKTLFFHTPQDERVKSLHRYTLAGLVKDNVLYLGIARCGRKDTFKRSTGRKIAEIRMKSGMEKPDTPGLKRKFCAVPFEMMIGNRGFAKEFVDQAILTVKTVDSKWAKVDFDSLRKAKLNRKMKKAVLTVAD
jgi:hypothetical protein